MFLPFAGCPHRCAYCDQGAVTGTGPRPMGDVLSALEADLDARRAQGRGPVELAFYGGTFTALPEPWPRRCLELAARYRPGTVGRVRCSTRPDAVSVDLLQELGALGLDAVELGVQSFHGPALAACGRGYGPRTALAGCAAVRQAGLELGVQLMPGLPGGDVASFGRDAARTAALAPAMVRLYPCLVLQDTPLALAWRQGSYAPWDLGTTVAELGRAVLALWGAGAAVIRTGLAPQPGLAPRILAGPTHPALGHLARSEALFLHLAGRSREMARPPCSLLVPRRHLSDVQGHGRSMLGRYAALGLGDIRAWDEPDFLLQ